MMKLKTVGICICVAVIAAGLAIVILRAAESREPVVKPAWKRIWSKGPNRPVYDRLIAMQKKNGALISWDDKTGVVKLPLDYWERGGKLGATATIKFFSDCRARYGNDRNGAVTVVDQDGKVLGSYTPQGGIRITGD